MKRRGEVDYRAPKRLKAFKENLRLEDNLRVDSDAAVDLGVFLPAQTNGVRVLFHNCHGLNDFKMPTYVKLLEEDKVDLIVLVETWCIASNLTKWTGYTLGLNEAVKSDTQLGKSYSGMIVLGLREWRDKVKTVKVESRHHFKVTFMNGLVVGVVYLPPSLNGEAVKQVLKSAQGCDFVVGDFNCFPLAGVPLFVEKSKAPDAKQVKRTEWLVEWTNAEHLHLLSVPKDGECTGRWDHAYGNDKVTVQEYVWIATGTVNKMVVPSGVNSSTMLSDHGIMFLVLDGHCFQEEMPVDGYLEEDQDVFRWRVRDLHQVVSRKNESGVFCDISRGDLIVKAMDKAGRVGLELARMRYSLRIKNVDFPRKDKTMLIERTYMELMATVKQVLDKNLIRYKVEADYKRAPISFAESLKAIDGHDSRVVSLWKKCNKGAIPNYVSETAGKTVGQVIVEAFQRIHKSELSAYRLDQVVDSVDFHEFRDVVNDELLKWVIKSYDSNKSGDEEGYQSRIFKCLIGSEVFMEYLCVLFNMCLNVGYTPVQWNRSVISLLPKVHYGANVNVLDTRPISLTVMLRRFFTKVWKRNVEQEKRPWNVLLVEQGAYLPGISSEAHALVAQVSMEGNRKCQAHVFLDIKKAFDTLSHDFLFKVLKERGASPLELTLLHSLLVNECQSSILVNGKKTISFARRTGVFQGDVLSPMLFNVCMDELAKRLRRVDALNAWNCAGDLDSFPTFLLWADDIRFQVPGANFTRTQAYLDETAAWAKEAGLDFGFDKCKVIQTGAEVPLFLLDGQELQVVTEYKYLGFKFTGAGIDFAHLFESNLKKAKGVLVQFQRKANKGIKESLKASLVKSYSRGAIRYGLGLYALWKTSMEKQGMCKELLQKHMEELYYYHYQCLSYIYGSDSPRILQESLCNLPGPVELLDFCKIQLLHHVHKLPESHPLQVLVGEVKQKIQDGNVFMIMSMSMQRSNIVYQMVTSELYKEFLGSASQNQSPKEWYNGIAHQKRLNALNGKLIQYVMRICRTAGGSDRCLDIDDDETRKAAVAWRRGVTLHKQELKSCVKCVSKSDEERRLTRRHLKSCSALLEYCQNLVCGVDGIALVDDGNADWFFHWTQQAQKRTTIRNASRQDVDKDHYTVLDHLLNLQEYSIFLEVHRFLVASIIPVTPVEVSDG